MSKAGLSDSVLLEKIRAEGVAARPTAEQAESLKKEGLSDAVVEGMENAPVVAPTETRVEYVYDDPYYGYYPYPYYSGFYGPTWYGHPYYAYGSYWRGYPYWGGGYYYSYPRGGTSVSHYRR